MNRNRIHQLGQGMADTWRGVVFNGRGLEERTLSQEAGGGRGSRRPWAIFASPGRIALAISGPLLAGLMVGIIYRSLRRGH